MTTQRIKELDLIRTVAIASVLMIHTSSFYVWFAKDFSWAGYFLYYAATSFSVPLFITLSGILLGLSTRAKGQNYFTTLKRRFIYICIPYVAWSIFYLLYQNQPLTLPTLLSHLAKGSAFFHLYFLSIIIQLYVLSPAFIYFSRREFRPHHLIVVFVAQLLIIELSKTFAPTIYNFLSKSFFIHWIFYFYAGCAIGSHYDRFKAIAENWRNAAIPLIFSILIYKIGDFYYATQIAQKAPIYSYAQVQSLENIPYTLLICAALVGFGFSTKCTHLDKGIQLISKGAFGIYLCHMFILRLLKEAFQIYEISFNNYIALLTFLLTLGTALIASTLIRKLPYGSLIVGK